MATAKVNARASGWVSLKKTIHRQDKSALVALVRDLYGLSSENRTFLDARFKVGDGLAPYKPIIEGAIYPDIYHGKPIRIAAAKKAIRQFRKATGDIEGTLELMTYFCARGTQFTADFGDVDEFFYASLEGVYHDVILLLKGDGSPFAPRFIPRLVAIRDSAKDIGWGYYDALCDMFAKAHFEQSDEPPVRE